MSDFETPIHDVLIIGAGPCGLAVAARLREPTPSALFTESEHQKFHFMKAQQTPSPSSTSNPKNKPIRTSRRANTSCDRLLRGHDVSHHSLDIAVLDAGSDQWMSSWNEKFADLNISHLRSPMFFHPDPRDRDGLLEFAVREGRMDELRVIEGVVGKELSKYQRKKRGKDGKRPQQTTYIDERDRHDYFRPSQPLFADYCASIVSRYDLGNLVQKAEVTSIAYSSTSSLFTVQTSTGVKKARIVVMAIGAAAKPSLPSDCPFCELPTDESVRHVFSKSKITTTNPDPKPSSNPSPKHTLLPPSLLYPDSPAPKTLAIIGGGLTSAQLCLLTSSHPSITKTHLILRKPLQTKHFDVDLTWLAKFKNHNMSAFWKADCDGERVEMMKAARGGGSVNPEFRGVVRRLENEGRVKVWEGWGVRDAKKEGDRWSLDVHEVVDSKGNVIVDEEGKKEDIVVDHVIYATGIASDINRVEAIKPLLASHPIETVGGMPCLTKELMWNEEVPFFVTGRLGGLRLGPAAPNLEGARLGAEFIAGKIASLMAGLDRDMVEDLSEEVDMRRLGLGRENQFEVLKLDGSGEDRSGGDGSGEDGSDSGVELEVDTAKPML